MFALLFLASQAAEGVFGVFAGSMLDGVGPRATVFVGVTLLAISHAILILDLGVVALFAGHVLLGGCQNFIVMPLVLVAERGPHKSIVTALLFCFQRSAAAVSPVMVVLNKRAPKLFMWCVVLFDLAIYAPALVLLVFLVPRQVVAAKRKDQQAKVMRNFLKALLKPEFLIFALWFNLTAVQFAVFNNILEYEGTVYISQLVGWLTCIQGVYVLGFGWLLDVTHVSIVLMGINGITIIINITYVLGFSSIMLQAILYTCVDACWVNAMYIYLSEYFNPDYFGKLAASLTLSAGIMQLAAYFISPKMKEFVLVCVVFMVLEVAAAGLMSVMFLKHAVGGHVQVEESESVESRLSSQWSEILAEISVDSDDFLDVSTDEAARDMPTLLSEMSDSEDERLRQRFM